ncbi:MAG: ABC transporter ATPase [Planctomycetota bacterium]|nr:ABC transporter ATPase [Planctomycetota bacterium]
MKTIPNNAPSNVAAIDERDPNAGGASHLYGIQYGGPDDVCRIQFQHGARAVEGSTAGVFDDDLLAIVQDRMEAFQAGPFACEENAAALESIKAAREALGVRVARRIKAGVLGVNKAH